MEAVRGPIRAVGRVALAAMFISGGADALLDPGPRTTKAAELGVPLDPELAVRVNGAAMASAGVAHVALSTDRDWLRDLAIFVRRRRA